MDGATLTASPFTDGGATRALAEGTLRLHTLNVGDSIIGVTYGFRVGDCAQVYVTAFDTAWADYSPGSRVMARTAEMAIDEGATTGSPLALVSTVLVRYRRAR